MKQEAERMDTDAIRAREKAATAGPWAIEPHDHIRKGCRCMCCLSVTGWGLTHRTSCEEVAAGPRPHVGSEWPPADPCDEAVLTYEDAEFIAHARTDIPALLAEVDRLREECERHRKANLVRAVVRYAEGHDDEAWLSDLITAQDFDPVPWRVAETAINKADRLREALRRVVDVFDDRTGTAAEFVDQIDAARALLGADDG